MPAAKASRTRHDWTKEEIKRLWDMEKDGKKRAEMIKELGIPEGPVRNKLYELRKEHRKKNRPVKNDPDKIPGKKEVQKEYDKKQTDADKPKTTTTVAITNENLRNIDLLIGSGFNKQNIFNKALCEFFENHKDLLLAARKLKEELNKI